VNKGTKTPTKDHDQHNKKTPIKMGDHAHEEHQHKNMTKTTKSPIEEHNQSNKKN
jgi:hypothetical protein